jgi:hypothetical protein
MEFGLGETRLPPRQLRHQSLRPQSRCQRLRRLGHRVEPASLHTLPQPVQEESSERPADESRHHSSDSRQLPLPDRNPVRMIDSRA